MLITSFVSRRVLAIVLLVACVPAGQAAEMLYPLAVAVHPDGTIYVGDNDIKQSAIWQVKEGTLAMYFQADKKLGTPIRGVRCLAIDHEGKLLAGDSPTREVYRFDDEGKPQPLTKGGIGIPMAMAVNRAGDIFVADLELHVIFKVPAAGGMAEEFAKVQAPRGLTIDAEGNLWVVCHLGDLLVKLSPDGKPTTVVAGQPLTAPAFPAGIVLDKDKNAYIADGYNHAIWKVAADGKPTKFAAGEPLVHPVTLAWKGENLIVADPRAKGLIEIDPAGKMTKLEIKPAP